jgi:hypothetical protein
VSATETGVLELTAVRARAAAALEPATDSDPAVLVDLVDAVHPPVLMLDWDDPWLTPGLDNRPVMGPCVWQANLSVICIASRVEPGPGVETLEQLVTYTIDRFRYDPYPWPVATAQSPRRFDIGGVTYLGARVGYRVPVTV